MKKITQRFQIKPESDDIKEDWRSCREILTEVTTRQCGMNGKNEERVGSTVNAKKPQNQHRNVKN